MELIMFQEKVILNFLRFSSEIQGFSRPSKELMDLPNLSREFVWGIFTSLISSLCFYSLLELNSEAQKIPHVIKTGGSIIDHLF